MSSFKECLSCRAMITEKIWSTYECPKCGSSSLYLDFDENDNDDEVDDDVNDDN